MLFSYFTFCLNPVRYGTKLSKNFQKALIIYENQRSNQANVCYSLLLSKFSDIHFFTTGGTRNKDAACRVSTFPSRGGMKQFRAVKEITGKKRYESRRYPYSVLAMPYSSPRSSARPLNRPMQEYPGLVFLFKSSSIWCPWSGRRGMDMFRFC